MVLGYGLLYASTAPVLSTAGVHWGSRFLLLLYPVLALLAAGSLADWRRLGGPVSAAGAVAIATAILLSVGSQVYSVVLLRRAQGFSDRLNTAVEARPEGVVVSRGWRTGQELARVFDRRQIFFLRDDEDWTRLRGRLRAAGVDQVLWIESAYARASQGPIATGEVVGDDGLGLYAVRLLPVRP
jgi:hypothetical protein